MLPMFNQRVVFERWVQPGFLKQCKHIYKQLTGGELPEFFCPLSLKMKWSNSFISDPHFKYIKIPVLSSTCPNLKAFKVKLDHCTPKQSAVLYFPILYPSGLSFSKQWLELTMLRATGPWALASCGDGVLLSFLSTVFSLRDQRVLSLLSWIKERSLLDLITTFTCKEMTMEWNDPIPRWALTKTEKNWDLSGN